MQRHISITFMSGPLDGKTMRFEQPDIGEEVVLSIGRREGCDIEIDFDNQVSRLHARLGLPGNPGHGDRFNHKSISLVLLAGRC